MLDLPAVTIYPAEQKRRWKRKRLLITKNISLIFKMESQVFSTFPIIPVIHKPQLQHLNYFYFWSPSEI